MPEAALLFSVIIPTHNRPAQLAECLHALAQMDFPPASFEVLVMDDGGSASLQQVFEAYRKRLPLSLFYQPRSGPAAARNAAARYARGIYLAFTDDDCCVAPDWLTRLHQRFLGKPDELYGGRTLNGLASNPYSAAAQAVIEVVYNWQPEARQFPQFFASNNLAVAANLFRRVGGFNPAFEVSEDREFCDRWAHHGYRLTFAPEVLIYHRHHLTLRTLLRQHFNYGRGARRFHRQRQQLGWGKYQPDGSFYLRLLRHGLGAPFSPTASVALLASTQLAIGAGYFWERAMGSPARPQLPGAEPMATVSAEREP